MMGWESVFRSTGTSQIFFVVKEIIPANSEGHVGKRSYALFYIGENQQLLSRPSRKGERGGMGKITRARRPQRGYGFPEEGSGNCYISLQFYDTNVLVYIEMTSIFRHSFAGLNRLLCHFPIFLSILGHFLLGH